MADLINSKEQNINFKSLRNIETSFKMIRTVMFAVILGVLALGAVTVWWAFRSMESSRQRVYVMENGKSIMLALAQDHNVNRDVEAKDHIRSFLRLFFTLEPNADQIKQTVNEALLLADNSVARLYGDLVEKGFYSNMIQGGVHQTIQVDLKDIRVDMSRSPYPFTATARMLLVRETTVTERNLKVEGALIDVVRTDQNPHGFTIEKFKPTDNADIRIETRD